MAVDDYLPRILSMVFLLGGTFIAGTLPILLVRKFKRKEQSLQLQANWTPGQGTSVTSFLLCFGGGVLFATCFIHLMPEVRESFTLAAKEDANSSDSDPDGGNDAEDGEGFPLPEFLVCAGFLAVYLVEEIIHFAIGHVHKSPEGPSTHGHSHSPAVLACSYRDLEMDQDQNGTVVPSTKSISVVANTTTRSKLNEAAENKVPTHYGSTVKDDNKGDVKEHGHGHGHSHMDADVTLTFSGLLIVAALSFHSIFEGLAIGLQDNSRDVWTMFVAVALHKFVIAFVVGLEVYVKGTRAMVVLIYMITFSLMSPLGILIGLLTERNLSDDGNLTVGYLTALATGTLLYVTFFEVLQKDRNSQLPGLLQLLAIFIGFGLMVLFNYYFPA